MSDLDLTEAVEEMWIRLAPGNLTMVKDDLTRALSAAAPLIEAQVRERIAADIEAMLTEGPWPPWFQAAVRETARIARGGPS